MLDIFLVLLLLCLPTQSKGKVVVHTDLTVDVNESANDEANIVMLVDDGNIIPHGEPVRAFQRYLRPIIIIHGAHLKGEYLDTMFLVVGMDGNNQILPIAFGVGKTESEESWIWFLSRLQECIGDMPSLAIISNRLNSIELAIQAVFPNAYHGLYCLHLLMNIRAKIAKQERTKILFWDAAKA
uniref:MULE transposase domain-containing protein n=1 Tax=Lactuca sativa TaxID=4236 RepID=A0A9R1ULU0_LACSA|nr:hypothetical protein LSAT_V11C800437630 [Lactuca sativa]